jgi:hypothetical protein
MTDSVKPEYIVLLIMAVPGTIGGILAYYRGRSVIGWCILAALFPVFILVIYFNKPLKEVPGGFRCCPGCREYVKWKDAACKYCGTPLG